MAPESVMFSDLSPVPLSRGLFGALSVSKLLLAPGSRTRGGMRGASSGRRIAGIVTKEKVSDATEKVVASEMPMLVATATAVGAVMLLNNSVVFEIFSADKYCSSRRKRGGEQKIKTRDNE